MQKDLENIIKEIEKLVKSIQSDKEINESSVEITIGKAEESAIIKEPKIISSGGKVKIHIGEAKVAQIEKPEVIRARDLFLSSILEELHSLVEEYKEIKSDKNKGKLKEKINEKINQILIILEPVYKVADLIQQIKQFLGF